MDFPPLSQFPEYLSLAPISYADICKAITTLKFFKSAGFDDIPGFVIKGCSKIFIQFLRHIFNVSLTQEYFNAGWKEAAIVLIS
jgi:hypothetical protein